MDPSCARQRGINGRRSKLRAAFLRKACHALCALSPAGCPVACADFWTTASMMICKLQHVATPQLQVTGCHRSSLLKLHAQVIPLLSKGMAAVARIFVLSLAVVCAQNHDQTMLRKAGGLLNSTLDDTLQCIAGCPVNPSTLSPKALCVLGNCTSTLAKCLFSSTCRSGIMCEARCTEGLAKTEDGLHFAALMECLRDRCPGFPPSKTCIALHCTKEAAECALHSKCRGTLECANGCVPSKYAAALDAVEQSVHVEV